MLKASLNSCIWLNIANTLLVALFLVVALRPAVLREDIFKLLYVCGSSFVLSPIVLMVKITRALQPYDLDLVMVKKGYHIYQKYQYEEYIALVRNPKQEQDLKEEKKR